MSILARQLEAGRATPTPIDGAFRYYHKTEENGAKGAATTDLDSLSCPVSTTAHLVQFARLWTLMQDVHLLMSSDTIRWRWTESGVYTGASAYRCQFV